MSSVPLWTTPTDIRCKLGGLKLSPSKGGWKTDNFDLGTSTKIRTYWTIQKGIFNRFCFCSTDNKQIKKTGSFSVVQLSTSFFFQNFCSPLKLSRTLTEEFPSQESLYTVLVWSSVRTSVKYAIGGSHCTDEHKAWTNCYKSNGITL